MKLASLSMILGVAACGSVSSSQPDAGHETDAAPPDATALDCHDPGIRDALFLVSYSAPEVEIYDCFSEMPDGQTGGTRVLAGANTGLTEGWYEGVAVDRARNLLYVSSFGDPSIRVFGNADTVSGDTAPVRVITSASFAYGGSMVLDETRDRLYYADETNGVLVFDGASTLDGAATPDATIPFTGLNLQQVDIDAAGDRLYATTTGAVFVYDAASTLTGTVGAADRTFALTETRGVSYDPAHDTLYVGARIGGGAVYAVANAHTANGTVTPARTITGSGTVAMDSVEQVQVANDELLVWNDGATDFWAYAPASAADGAATPSRTFHVGVNAGTVAGGRYVP